MPVMANVFKALKSIKLALALIAYLVIASVAASVLPRGASFYSTLYFLIPAFLFFANLAACSADRFAREIKKGGAGRHGPDILHLGLILLLIGAVLGQAAKASHPGWEGYARLGRGDAVQLPNGDLLVLKSLASENYPDGRPKNWISTVELSRAGKTLIPSFDIRVNHPLRMGALSIFQSSFGSERVLELEGPASSKRSLAAGEYIDDGSSRLMLMSVDLESGTAIARAEKPQGATTIILSKGSKIGPFTVAGPREALLSGLQAAYDPFYPVVIAGFIFIGLGAFITFARRLGELKA
jgi:cytochrome c biogenesis protein